MKARAKRLWLAALRSGHYKQTQNALRNEDGFCCLGVLCDVHRKQVNSRWRRPNGGAYFYKDMEEFLPTEVIKWAGLDSEDPFVNGGSLSSLNDNKGYSFDTIADIIEKSL